MTTEEILRVEHLSISFGQYDGGFRRTRLDVIRDLSVTVHAGEMVAVVGSSGSGKSLLAHGILGILPYNAVMGGTLTHLGQPLTPQRQKQLRGKEIVLVPQSTSYLDPLMKIGPQIHNDDPEAEKRTPGVLDRYHLDRSVVDQFPFALSGGMTRRVLISTAVVQTPRLIIADEPTPGLHLSVAKRVLSHFREIADEGAGVLLITHDLELALEVADRVVVFYAGTTVEDAAAADFRSPDTLRHPYSRALWHAIPQNGFQPIPGTQPYVKDLPRGCPFAPRCPKACAACSGDIPWREERGGWVRCVREEAAL